MQRQNKKENGEENMKNLEQFDVMTSAELSTVEGGKSKEGRDMGCILGTAGMAGAGFLVAGPAGVGLAMAVGGAAAGSFCRWKIGELF